MLHSVSKSSDHSPDDMQQPEGAVRLVLILSQVLEKREAPTAESMNQRTVMYGINQTGLQALAKVKLLHAAFPKALAQELLECCHCLTQACLCLACLGGSSLDVHPSKLHLSIGHAPG